MGREARACLSPHWLLRASWSEHSGPPSRSPRLGAETQSTWAVNGCLPESWILPRCKAPQWGLRNLLYIRYPKLQGLSATWSLQGPPQSRTQTIKTAADKMYTNEGDWFLIQFYSFKKKKAQLAHEQKFAKPWSKNIISIQENLKKKCTQGRATQPQANDYSPILQKCRSSCL